MTSGNSSPTELQWQAINGNDGHWDGRFWYGVRTTGIFCKPSCKSRPPNRSNVSIFMHPDQALSEGFRPCKRCKPTGNRPPVEEWVDGIADYLDRHYRSSVSLESLSRLFHSSPWHLQRLFKRVKGVSPMQYAQRLRLEAAKSLLTGTDKSAACIAEELGIGSSSYFTSAFKRMTGLTPSAYRETTRKEGSS